jgi:hypothetical protein
MGYSATIEPQAEAVRPIHEASPLNAMDRRKHPRVRVLKAAKIILNDGNIVYDCLIMDESAGGVFVDMGALVALPPEVTIRFASGATFRAVRRWNSGTKFGFEYCGKQIISHETAKRMQAVCQILTNHGLPAAVNVLRIAQYFDSPELRRLATEAAAAHHKFESALRGEVVY